MNTIRIWQPCQNKPSLIKLQRGNILIKNIGYCCLRSSTKRRWFLPDPVDILAQCFAVLDHWCQQTECLGDKHATARYKKRETQSNLKDLHLVLDIAYLTIGPSWRMCSSSTRGLSLLRSLWIKVRVSCTSTDGTSVKRSVSPCQIWSPAERYVELR